MAKDLDVYVAAGGDRTAYTVESVQLCTDGAMSIELGSQVENPMISAVEIIFESLAQFTLTTTEELYEAVDNYLAGNLPVPINDLDVSLITNFDETFSSNRNPDMRYFSGDLDRWDVSRAVSMSGMVRPLICLWL